jgi:hypothetical protein
MRVLFKTSGRIWRFMNCIAPNSLLSSPKSADVPSWPAENPDQIPHVRNTSLDDRPRSPLSTTLSYAYVAGVTVDPAPARTALQARTAIGRVGWPPRRTQLLHANCVIESLWRARTGTDDSLSRCAGSQFDAREADHRYRLYVVGIGRPEVPSPCATVWR